MKDVTLTMKELRYLHRLLTKEMFCGPVEDRNALTAKVIAALRWAEAEAPRVTIETECAHVEATH